MKLHEINRIEFKEYGSIIQDSKEYQGSDFEHCKKLTSATNKSNQLYMCDSPMFLEPIDGVGVVFIKDNEVLKMFLFDKVIMINPNIWFSVVPYQCTFVYQISYDGVIKNEKLEESLTATGIHRRININAIYTVLYQEKTKKFQFRGEKHPYWELTYMDRGNMICNIDGEDVLLKQGELIFFTPNQFHIQRAANNQSLNFFTITFDLDFEDTDLFKYKIIKADMEIHRCIKQILSEERMDLIYSDEVMLATLTKLFVIAIRIARESRIVTNIRSTLNENTTNDLVTNCINFIDENIADKLTLEILADKVCISPSYLSKLFKSELGKGPGEYVKDARLQKAKYLIRNGTYSITQISDMLGYCSITYFSTEFKKKFGATPREYSKSVLL